MDLDIRVIESDKQLQDCVRIQRLVWGFADRDIVTPGMLSTCRDFGGILLGAYSGDSMLGFVFSLPALLGRVTVQHSHMLAVLAGYRDQSVGTKLKLAQLEYAKELGVPLITWTFDPLESRNAYLNLNILGVSVRRYYVDLYGSSTSSELHSGLGTDRFLAEWEVGPRRKPVEGSITEEKVGEIPQSIVTCRDAEGLLAPGDPILSLQAAQIAVEVPSDIQKLKLANGRLAIQWREATRRVFRHYLGTGYEIRGLMVVKDQKGLPRRSFYNLTAAR
jgi:predicted GNAT superfamily acetyltransferase